LPHAHILLFLHPSNKYPSLEDINKIISAEIPDQQKDPLLYECVKNHIMHGPCGLTIKASPCMKNGRCSKFFPKKKFKQQQLLIKMDILCIGGEMMKIS